MVSRGISFFLFLTYQLGRHNTVAPTRLWQPPRRQYEEPCGRGVQDRSTLQNDLQLPHGAVRAAVVAAMRVQHAATDMQPPESI